MRRRPAAGPRQSVRLMIPLWYSVPVSGGLRELRPLVPSDRTRRRGSGNGIATKGGWTSIGNGGCGNSDGGAPGCAMGCSTGARCGRRDSNPHGACAPAVFKTAASAFPPRPPRTGPEESRSARPEKRRTGPKARLHRGCRVAMIGAEDGIRTRDLLLGKSPGLRAVASLPDFAISCRVRPP